MGLKWKDVKRHLDAMTPEDLEDPAVICDLGERFAQISDVRMSQCDNPLIKDQIVLVVPKTIS